MKLIARGGKSTDVKGHKTHGSNDTDKEFKVIKHELLQIYDELKDRLKDVNDATRSLKEECAALNNHRDVVDDDIVDYLEVRQQSLLSYCANMTYYAYLKTTGKSIEQHPVIRQLAEQRYLIEKMRPLDAKLKYQIDRLLTYASLDEKEMKSASLRPNLAAMLDDDDSDDDNDHDQADDESNEENDPANESDDDNSKIDRKNNQIYKAPKLAAMPYQDTESAIEKREKQILKKKNKLRNSEILETLREEFSTKPEQSSSSGIGSFATGEQRKLKAEAEERRRFEEDRFIRTSLSRKEKKDLRKRSRDANNIDNFDSLGDVDDFQDLADLASRNNKRDSKSNKGGGSKVVDTSHSLTKALNVFKKKKM